MNFRYFNYVLNAPILKSNLAQTIVAEGFQLYSGTNWFTFVINRAEDDCDVILIQKFITPFYDI